MYNRSNFMISSPTWKFWFKFVQFQSFCFVRIEVWPTLSKEIYSYTILYQKLFQSLSSRECLQMLFSLFIVLLHISIHPNSGKVTTIPYLRLNSPYVIINKIRKIKVKSRGGWVVVVSKSKTGPTRINELCKNLHTID